MEYFVVYDIGSGLPLYRGNGYQGYAAAQSLQDGQAVMLVPQQAFASPTELDLAVIKISYAAAIDQDADRVRGMYITNTPSQVATYLEKEAEARRILAGDLTNLLYLPLEAAAVGKDLQALAADVVALAAEWRPINARIEAARLGAKDALAKAQHLAAIAAAVKISWPAVVAEPQELAG